ncbi:unnamed protein product [Spirodela intermedia]|uniref:Uncharacterized protein n=1 Tax=Spirodela intermedia TaxID=51605 RepID=A0A7I8IBN4_SPIIN|nr:unnamed protein product [Spirodela intermedia]CAA6655156.1 unnamed protein product [Spirodela intermedia]
MRARGAATGGDHRGARGGASCGAGWGRLGALLRSHRRHPPTPRVGRLSSLDPPARARRSNDRGVRTPRNPPSASAVGWSGAARAGVAGGRATWLILPVVICLSQRLSHACVSMN